MQYNIFALTVLGGSDLVGTNSGTRKLGYLRQWGGCERDKANKTALVCCPSHSLYHLLGHVYNIPILRTEGQGSSKMKVGISKQLLEMATGNTRMSCV